MRGMHFSLDPIPEILARRNLEPFGEVQKYIDSEVLRLSSPYVPHLSGTLEKSGNLHTDIGSGEVVWNTPYARFQYYEKVMVGEKSRSAWAKPNEKKVVINKKLQYHGGGLRGGFWFERMKADHKSDIIKGAAEIAGGTTK